MGKGLAEYVIRLSTELDNSGVQQILNYMDLTKLKALGLTAALSGISTAIYKFAESTAKKEYELRKLAKSQKKTTAEINAQNNALKAMGKTMEEVNKSKDLKEVYNDIKKFNEEMKLPNVDEAMEKITKLRNAFWKMKDALNMAVQSIGRQFLINMQRPIERITQGMNDISDWVKYNLNSITAKVTSVLTAFSKGIIGIGDTVGFIFQKVNELPTSVKAIGIAIAGVYALVNMGPFGRLLTLFTLVGGFIDDIENYNLNVERGLHPGDTDYIRNLNDDTGIYDIIFGSDPETSAYEIMKKVLEGLSKALTDVIDTLDDASIDGWLSGETGFVSKILRGIERYLKSSDGIKTSGDVISKVIDTVLSLNAAGGRIATSLAGTLAPIIGSALGSTTFTQGMEKLLKEDNSITAGTFSGVITALLTKGNVGLSLASAFTSAFKNARLDAMKRLYEEDLLDAGEPENVIKRKLKNVKSSELEKDYANDPDLQAYIFGDLSKDFADFITGAWDAACGLLAGGGEWGATILASLVDGIIKSLVGATDEEVTALIDQSITGMSRTNIFSGLVNGITGTVLSGGNLLIGIGSALVTMVTGWSERMKNDPVNYPTLQKAIEADAEEFWQGILTLWYGPLENPDAIESETNKRQSKYGLASIVMPALEGEYEEFVNESGKWVKQNKKNGGLFGDGGIIGWLFGYDEYAEYEVLPDGTKKKIDSSVKRVKGIFEQAWSGKDGTGGISGWISGLWSEIEGPVTDIATNIANSIMSAIESAWLSFWNSNWLIQKLFGNPNSSGLSYDMDTGKYVLKTSDGKVKTFESGELTQSAQAVLSVYGNYFTLDDNGNIKMTNGGGEIGATGNFGLFGYDGNPLTLREALQYIIKNGKLPGEGSDNAVNLGGMFSEEGYGVRFGVNFDTAEEFFKAFKFDKGKGGIVVDTIPDVDISTIQSQIDEGTYTVNAIVKANGEDGDHEAWGGRIGNEMHNVTVGEDGTEYIIPITKPERAATLIRQMFGEMGSAATQQIMSGLGLGQSGTNGASMASLETAMGGMAMSNNFNINAPVNINVNSTGADAKEIGSTVYDLAERHLIKNVMGVYA